MPYTVLTVQLLDFHMKTLTQQIRLLIVQHDLLSGSGLSGLHPHCFHVEYVEVEEEEGMVLLSGGRNGTGGRAGRGDRKGRHMVICSF